MTRIRAVEITFIKTYDSVIVNMTKKVQFLANESFLTKPKNVGVERRRVGDVSRSQLITHAEYAVKHADRMIEMNI